MIVVSDTSPITALLTIQQIDLLARLYGEVKIPPAVAEELLAYHTELPDFIQTMPAFTCPIRLKKKFLSPLANREVPVR